MHPLLSSFGDKGLKFTERLSEIEDRVPHKPGARPATAIMTVERRHPPKHRFLLHRLAYCTFRDRCAPCNHQGRSFGIFPTATHISNPQPSFYTCCHVKTCCNPLFS